MARGEAKAAAAAWLKQQGLIESLDDDQWTEVQKLIGDPAFGILYAMLMYQRAEYMVMLSNVTLGTPEKDSHASVLQGNIRAIDRMHETLLMIAEPTADAAQQNEEQE